MPLCDHIAKIKGNIQNAIRELNIASEEIQFYSNAEVYILSNIKNNLEDFYNKFIKNK